MNNSVVHDFGVVDPMDDYYELFWETGKSGQCSLEEIVQTERGPRKSKLAVIQADVWRAVSDRVIRELSEGMGETERSKKPPSLKCGTSRLSPLIGRELAILFWAIMEMSGDRHIEAILHGWRELAREERWWLYAKAAAPGQRSGTGWRIALFHALSESVDSRADESASPEKKTPGIGSGADGQTLSKRKTLKKQSVPSQKPASSLKKPTAIRTKKPKVNTEIMPEAKGQKTAKKKDKKDSKDGYIQLELF